MLKSSLKEMRQTASGTALYYASLFLWLTGQQVKAKEYISRTLKASSSSREVPAPGRHLSAGRPQDPALPAPEAWDWERPHPGPGRTRASQELLLQSQAPVEYTLPVSTESSLWPMLHIFKTVT